MPTQTITCDFEMKKKHKPISNIVLGCSRAATRRRATDVESTNTSARSEASDVSHYTEEAPHRKHPNGRQDLLLVRGQ